METNGFEITINVSFSFSPLHLNTYMFSVYGQYKYVHSLSGRTVFRRQHVKYKDDPRAARLTRERQRGGGAQNVINVIIMGSILKLGKRG